MSEVFVRVHDGKSVADSGRLDLIIYLRGKWAYIAWENDEVGTDSSLPKGHAAGVSQGTLGRVGGVMTCEHESYEYEGSGVGISEAPIPSGPAAGLITVSGSKLTVSGTKKADGTFEALKGGEKLPKALRLYTDKLDAAFRNVLPY